MGQAGTKKTLKKLMEFKQAIFIFLSFILVTSLTVISVGWSEHNLQEEKKNNPLPVEEEDEVSRETQEEQDVVCEEEEERLAIEEREALEEQRREEYGKYYVPLPPLNEEKVPPVKARGLYLTGHTVGHPRYRDILDMVEDTELNSLVIDVKDDHGLMTYPSEIDIIQEAGADDRVPVQDMRGILKELEEKGIFPIARVVVFKDPYLAEQKNEWAIQRKEGGIWRDNEGVGWVDPFNKKVWDYNIAVAREAALMGFSEIQFDYVRFPENASRMDKEAEYPAQSDVNKEKDELIRDFLLYAGEKLADYNVYLSADVFGVITTSWGDSDRIGQTWEMLSTAVDYICPMVYPSHYGPGYFDLDVPDAYPRETVKNALRDAIERNAPLEAPGIIRPWLQSFTASWIQGNISYGPEEVRAQIDMALELGIDEFLLWNARNRYNDQSLLSEEESNKRSEELVQSRKEAGKDALGRTPLEAVETFIESLEERDWRKALPLHSSDSLDYKNYSSWMRSLALEPQEYDINTFEPPGDNKEKWFENGLIVDLEVHLFGDEHNYKLSEENWEVFIENHIWQVKPSEEFIELLQGDNEHPERQYNQDFRGMNNTRE